MLKLLERTGKINLKHNLKQRLCNEEVKAQLLDPDYWGSNLLSTTFLLVSGPWFHIYKIQLLVDLISRTVLCIKGINSH